MDFVGLGAQFSPQHHSSHNLGTIFLSIPIPPRLGQGSMRKQPDTAILRKACSQGWPLTGIWEVSHCALTVPQTGTESGSLSLNCLYVQYGLCCTPAFLLGIWSFGTCWTECAYVTRLQ